MKDKLIEVLSIQSESYNQFRVFSYIIRQLKKLGCNYYTFNGCIYATKGDADNYPCIVSHMDTVHEIVENLTVVEVAGNLTGFNRVTMEQTGIGGDDKVGIFIALQCLENFDNIKAVFFRDEEIGCDGSYSPDKTFFEDCNYVLQCDRKGNRDFVTNASGIELSCNAFKNDIKPILNQYGYKFANGMMTDVMALKEMGIKCSMANMSCGYYNPHCYNEYVNVLDVINCLNMVIHIITKMQKSYTCIPKKEKKYAWKEIPQENWKYDFNDFTDFWNEDKKQDSKKKDEICECCQEVAKLEYVKDYRIDMCEKCIKDYVRF